MTQTKKRLRIKINFRVDIFSANRSLREMREDGVENNKIVNPVFFFASPPVVDKW